MKLETMDTSNGQLEANNGTILKPDQVNQIDLEKLAEHVNGLVKKEEPVKHFKILDKLLKEFKILDFVVMAFPEVDKLRTDIKNLEEKGEDATELIKRLHKIKVNTKHLLVLSIENVLKVAKENEWGLCKNLDFIYLFNGAYWNEVDKETFQKFLGEASEQMGVTKFSARYYQFREQLYKQFISTAYLPTPKSNKNSVLINLKNGTFEISSQGTKLRQFNRSDFITYQLPFEYNPSAKAPLFQNYLDRVLPNKDCQNVLAEYLGYVFIKHGSNWLKEEKALILYGSGANGKSVFFEIVSALFGENNTSNFSLQSLTNDNGYFRAKLANKLVNYASEINGKLQSAIFKQLVSGEPVEARLPYGEPFTLKQYAKLIFNCNDLPRDVENTNAYFRRFLIIPFEVTIPSHEQDKQLHTKIIEKELSGVFNWVLDGLNRLLQQKRFTDCESINQAIENYKSQSDSVKMFTDENKYINDPVSKQLIKDLYIEYRTFCIDDGFKPVNKSNFIKRLNGFGVLVKREKIGNVAYLKRNASD